MKCAIIFYIKTLFHDVIEGIVESLRYKFSEMTHQSNYFLWLSEFCEIKISISIVNALKRKY